MGLVISTIQKGFEDCGNTMKPSGQPTYRKATMMTPRHPLPGVIYYSGEHPLKSASKTNRINDIVPLQNQNQHVDEVTSTDDLISR